MLIPLEIVNEIILHILEDDQAPPEKTGACSKPNWHHIEAFTLTCWDYRLNALAVWFKSLYIKSASELYDIHNIFPDLKGTWTRHLHCVQNRRGKVIKWDLAGFKQLKSIRIDWLHESVYAGDLAGEDDHYFINVDSPIRALDIRGLRYPSPMTLRQLTAPFKHISTLKLDSLQTWCGLCNTSCLIRFPTLPGDLTYKGGLGLSIHYARVLCSLQNLRQVVISLPDLGLGVSSAGLPIDTDANAWTGECDRCMAQLYDDPKFKRSWMARKRGIIVDGIEGKSVYAKPPQLECVQWKFWPFKDYYEERSYSNSDVIFEDVLVELSESDSDEE